MSAKETVQDPPSNSEATTDGLDLRIPLLKAEISKLRTALHDIKIDEAAAQEEMRSLTYAAQLTRDEVQRRSRANSELRSAYEIDHFEDDVQSELAQVRRLEGELFNAKRDSANIIFEVEQLEFYAKKLEDAGRSRPVPTFNPVSPRSPRLRSPISSTLASTVSKGSPTSRPSRLIGDLDCIVAFEGEDPVTPNKYAPCRLGISANGRAAIYSYASPMPLIYLDERNMKMRDLSETDKQALILNMDTVGLQVSGHNYNLCGLRESVAASLQLIRDTKSSLKVDSVDDK